MIKQKEEDNINGFYRTRSMRFKQTNWNDYVVYVHTEA